MFEFIYLNPHIFPFYISFYIGLIILIAVPIHYMIRKKMLLLEPFAFFKLNKRETKAIILGIILAAIGIIGIAFISEKYGYYRSVTDRYGNKVIEKSKPDLPPGVVE